VAGFFRFLGRRRVVTDEERLAWLIVVATVPVGALGLVFEHQFRALFAKPVAAALFLMANGVILPAGEQHRRRQEARGGAVAVGHAPQATLDTRIVPMDDAAERELSRIGVASAAIIGASEVLAL
jgi:undecaprenyl pyrophosphate phosphatase UppP